MSTATQKWEKFCKKFGTSLLTKVRALKNSKWKEFGPRRLIDRANTKDAESGQGQVRS